MDADATALRSSGVRKILSLGLLIAGSTAIRSIFAWRHSTARYLPDEYFYATLARSIGHGSLQIRGKAAHFPSLLEPMLAAPLWRLFSMETAYHLVQVQNAVAASLAAIPVYALARYVGLKHSFAMFAAVYALVVPTLAMIPLTISDLVAYPLALGAVAVGVQAIGEPSWKRQAAFLVLAALATLGRVQYFVLVPAYLAAAAMIDRRETVRRHKTALLSLVPAVGALAVGLTGFYSHLGTLPFNASVIKWLGIQTFLLVLTAGVVIVPGAVAGALAANGRRERAFAYFGAAMLVLVSIETSEYSSAVARFRERYLFAITPLLAIAFGLYLKRGRPHIRTVIGISLAIVVAAARMPISHYTLNAERYDSQFLSAMNWLQHRLGAGSASLIVALLASAGALGSLVIARLGDRVVGLLVATLSALSVTVVAVHVDLDTTSSLRASLPKDLRWVDHSADGPVTAISTPLSGVAELELQLYWNTSVNRERVLTTGIGTDLYATDPLLVNSSGALPQLHGDFLFDDSGSRATFYEARLVRQEHAYALWRPTGTAPPRFRLLVEGYLRDNWLTPDGRFHVWLPPGTAHTEATRLTFTLSLPSTWPRAARIVLGANVFAVRPGQAERVTCTSRTDPLALGYKSPDVVLDSLGRPLTIRMTDIVVRTVPSSAVRGDDSTCRPV